MCDLETSLLINCSHTHLVVVLTNINSLKNFLKFKTVAPPLHHKNCLIYFYNAQPLLPTKKVGGTPQINNVGIDCKSEEKC